MKAFLIILIGGWGFYNPVFAQCPSPGLKIQSAACDSPTDLRINTATCQSLKVDWQGQQNQTYIVQATGVLLISGQTYQVQAAQYACNGHGDCQATIPVQPGSTVNWTVQGTCTEGGNTLNSYPSYGPPATIPSCTGLLNNTTEMLRVYPNPTAGNLTVEYNGDVNGNTRFIVYDVNGKQVFNVGGSTVTRAGTGYTLTLYNLLTGTYFLTVSNGSDEKRARFVLIRN